MRFSGFGSLKFKNSLIIISVMVPLLVVFLAYDLYRQSGSMRKALTDRGVILAQTGAGMTSKILSDAIKSGILTEEQVFDTDYKPIPGTNPPKYRTAYDSFTDVNLRGIEDAFLKDRHIVYAVAVDRNGYLPTHNTIFSQSGNDIHTNRTKRIFDDPVGIAAAQNQEPYLFQEYRRDTGEVMWDISAPIYVNNRHWGAFRVGFSIDETNKQIAAVRNQIVGGGVVLILVLVALVLYISYLVTAPVKRLEEKVRGITQGDFTVSDLCEVDTPKDELGSLIRSFCNMIFRLRQLAEKMRGSADLVAAYTGDLQKSIQDAAGTARTTAAQMTRLAQAMEKIEESAGEVAKASEGAVVSLLKTEKTSERFIKQMESSSVVMTRAGEAVKELESHVEKLGDIIQFIALIADQANLLAQKAVTEAESSAASGGSNFSAMAAEIQKRAQDAAAATRGIAGLFERARKHAQQATQAMEKDQQVVLEGYQAAREASQSVKAIVADLKNLAAVVKEVAAYARQVSEGISGVNAAAEAQAALVEGFTEVASVLDAVVAEMQETLVTLRF
ncbi:MAG: methyl-accepting chemotaxis protein [Peptococcaceae bacterium]|nr:methyl-accepting chemotaxis protein [Peptococcaceae bacterium]